MAGFPGTNRPHYPTRKEQKSTPISHWITISFPWEKHSFPWSKPVPICHCQGQSQFVTVKAIPNLPLSRPVPICHCQGQSQFAIVKANPSLPLSRPFLICHCQGQSQFATIKASPNILPSKHKPTSCPHEKSTNWP